MKNEIIKIIKGYECDAFFGANLNHLKESDYEDVAEDIVKLFCQHDVNGQFTVDECKCIRFTGGNKWYTNGCKIHTISVSVCKHANKNVIGGNQTKLRCLDCGKQLV